MNVNRTSIQNQVQLYKVVEIVRHCIDCIFKMSVSDNLSIDAQGACNYALVQDSFIKGALQLACDVAAVCGRKHWAWKMGMLR